ncbi:MAG: IS1096 element passenger TnpR family protein [Thermoleophilia bacterium]
MEEELNANLFVLSFFADRQTSERVFREVQLDEKSHPKYKTFEEMTATIVSLFPMAMENYALMGMTIHRILIDLGYYEQAFSDSPEPERRSPRARGQEAFSGSPKPGRNEPCPCGSGRKYKKCCGTSEPAKPNGVSTVYQLKIILKGSKPPIWRRIQTPDTTLDRLSDYILTAMGWIGGHLHGFRARNQFYGVPDPEWGTQDMIDESTVRLSDIVSPRQKKFSYEYDFGDGWEHEALVEKVLEAEPGAVYPVCLTGRRACPPEDVGGIYGYYDFLEAIGDPGNPDHDDLLEWTGGEFDPVAFDLEETNEALKDVARTGWSKL